MPSKWILKAIVQKAISVLPRPERVNFLFQKYVTKGVILDDAHFQLKLESARDHTRYFEKYIPVKGNYSLLELGAGWYPIIPLAFFLQDMGSVISVDIYNWMKVETIFTTIKKFIDWKEDGRIEDYLRDSRPEKWKILYGLLERENDISQEEINELIGLKYIIQDARALPIEDQSIDFICSNNTFEHVRVDILEGILAEFWRILKQGGLMSHFIDMSDHFAHFDTKISIYNFLRYSEKQWKVIDNRIQPQNRLRLVDFRRMYESLGIPITEEFLISEKAQELDSVKVHKEWNEYSREELAISHGFLISLKQ